MIKKHLVLALLGLSLALPNAVLAQEKDKKEKKEKTKSSKNDLNKEFQTASGLKYKITQLGSGPRAKAGDIVSVHYTGKLTNDTVFDSSVKRGQPFSFKLGQGQVIKGWDEGIALLNVGDKAVFTIPAALGYGERAMGKIPANATLIFEVELLKIKEKPKPFDVTGKDTITTQSGLKIILVKANMQGVQAQKSQNIEVHYTGYFKDGNIFDSSMERDQPIVFPIGEGRVIPGWDEGLSYLKTGEKARLIIPFQLAYGEQGRPPIIPPSSDLIFDVELISIK